jgi:Short C-terminal domain
MSTEPVDEPLAEPAPRSPRRALPIVLTVMASIAAFLAIFSLWANRQFLNTDAWTDTSSELLEQPAVKSQVSGFLVDQLYTNVDVAGLLREALPPRADPLAGPAANALRGLAEKRAKILLGRPRVQTLWEEANRRAHTRLLQVLEGGGDVVSTGGGVVTLDLKALLGQTENSVGVGGRVQSKLPADAAQITIMRSDQLGLAQDVLRILKALPLVLVGLALLLYTLAVYLARGRRREALRACGFGLVGAGVLALLVRSWAGDAVVDSLAKTDAVRPAVQVTWDLTTPLLEQAASAAIFYGAFIVVGTWLAGPTAVAVWVRRQLAPFMREPRFAYVAFAAVVVLILAWAPTPALRQPVTALILMILLLIGMEVFRRQAAREFPEPSLEELMQRAREGLRGMWERGRNTARQVSHGRQPDRMTQLERLNTLRASGALDAEEFEAEKRKILAAPTSPAGPPTSPAGS